MTTHCFPAPQKSYLNWRTFRDTVYYSRCQRNIVSSVLAKDAEWVKILSAHSLQGENRQNRFSFISYLTRFLNFAGLLYFLADSRFSGLMAFASDASGDILEQNSQHILEAKFET
ncbi:hypothetical protein DdX_13107 [Ditylenchus destructor]|uniref:Uncharacterized protein n=1 Tax=Ditylenchus destructor TaxID=166010 RepID=A0AAD4R339_9BILA|nr:hypothetical protein DdX_13107 [Ditylenchus destructor]